MSDIKKLYEAEFGEPDEHGWRHCTRCGAGLFVSEAGYTAHHSAECINARTATEVPADVFRALFDAADVFGLRNTPLDFALESARPYREAMSD